MEFEPFEARFRAFFCGVLVISAASAIGVAEGRRVLRSWSHPEEEVQRQMDVLAKSLNQDQVQFPLFAGRDAEKTTLRLAHDKATPLAARWGAHALQGKPRSVVAKLRTRYVQQYRWAWRYEGSVEVGKPSTEDAKPQAWFVVQGYSNCDLPANRDRLHDALEYYHFAFFRRSGNSADYWGSFSVQSEELMGVVRVITLKKIQDGKPRVVDVFDRVPAYSEIRDRVSKLLEAGGAKDGKPAAIGKR